MFGVRMDDRFCFLFSGFVFLFPLNLLWLKLMMWELSCFCQSLLGGYIYNCRRFVYRWRACFSLFLSQYTPSYLCS
ncbi:uncharacterized protein BCR38DRAFT_426982 [Pseudomassariella vexata]|uniref:Uncharacterized protein n=1 Tax=Pseudomassariella vexata TaxID=1141098 RepID=A0A1Y2E977_9PEZI|nr:uncharacterized protein BCR38DRAFT_426982 [Pseudomassariella vexata]ORY67415.1 hypothetical protein BCR38DRAFT_426982 [Pseudomassariella vexata]